jgi:hypothetical protein
MWMDFGCGTSFLPETPEARQDFFCGSPRVLVNLETVEKLYFIFFAEPRRCSGRRVACEDIEGLQPTRLPLQVERISGLSHTSEIRGPSLFGNNAVTILLTQNGGSCGERARADPRFGAALDAIPESFYRR